MITLLILLSFFAWKVFGHDISPLVNCAEEIVARLRYAIVDRSNLDQTQQILCGEED